MRKHFLILMLMALLPLAGYAENYSEWTVTLSETTSVYTGNEKNVTVTLTKAGETPVTITNGVDGWTLTWSATPLRDKAEYTLTVTNSGTHTAPAAPGNTATYTITQATNAITGLALAGWTYGDLAKTPVCTPAFGAPTYTYSTTIDGEYGTYDAKVDGQAGTYYVKASVEATANYTAATSDPVQFTIAKKNLRAKARAFTAAQTIFGVFENTTEVAIDYTGFVTGDDAASVFTGTYVAPTAVIATAVKATDNCVKLSDDKYYIKAGNYEEALEVTGGTAKNYEVICLNNDLNIAKAKVKVDLKAAPGDAVFGSAAASKIEWPIAWTDADIYLTIKRQVNNTGTEATDYQAVDADDFPAVVLRKGAGTAASPYAFNSEVKMTRENTSTNKGEYLLALSGVEATANTVIEEQTNSTDLKFKITAAILTIKAGNKWKVYGEADPKNVDGSWAYTVKAGAVAYDGLSDAQNAAIKAGLIRTEGETVGDYKIAFTQALKDNELFADNYTIDWTDGWLTIEKADLTIAAKEQTLYVGNQIDKLVQTEYTVEGLVKNADLDIDDVATISLVFGTTNSATETEVPVGTGDDEGKLTGVGSPYTHGIKIVLANEDALAVNYNIIKTNGKLTVINTNDGIVLQFAADNTEALAAAHGKTIEVTFGNKTMVKDNWHTMVLPFKTTPLELSKILDKYVVVNRLSATKSSATHVAFELELKEIPAGEAFLIKCADDMVWDGLKFDETHVGKMKIFKDPVAESKGGNKLVGVYATTSVQSTDDQMIGWLGNTSQKKADGVTPRENKWYEPYNDPKDIAPFEAYLMYAPGTTTAPLITVEEADGSTTAISEVKAGEFQAIKTDGWYTINGVKLEGAPTQKGIYINNGKKIVVK